MLFPRLEHSEQVRHRRYAPIDMLPSICSNRRLLDIISKALNSALFPAHRSMMRRFGICSALASTSSTHTAYGSQRMAVPVYSQRFSRDFGRKALGLAMVPIPSRLSKFVPAVPLISTLCTILQSGTTSRFKRWNLCTLSYVARKSSALLTGSSKISSSSSCASRRPRAYTSHSCLPA
jgi:hypothetical protein